MSDGSTVVFGRVGDLAEPAEHDQPTDRLTPVRDRRRSRAGVRIALHVAWVLLLSVGVQLRIGRFGFNPTDQGFILAASWRILHGEIPHVDIISARPLGSPILHVVDFALPGPLFLMSGLLSMVEITLTGIALTALLTRRPVLSWGPLITGAVAAAVLINVNTEPMMAWHTIDGITLTACGWWALDAGLRSGRAWPRRLGLFLLGFAVLTKQSFAPAVLIGLGILLLHPAARAGFAPRTGAWWRRLVLDVVVLAAAPICYFGVVIGAGGLGDAVGQLTGGTGAYDQRLFEFVTGLVGAGAGKSADGTVVVLGTAVVLVVLRLSAERLGRFGRVADRLAVLGGGAAVVFLIGAGNLVYSGDWASALFWGAVAAVLTDGINRRRLPWRGLLVVGLAAMSTLSWGVTTPTALAGTLALSTVVLLLDGMPPIDVPALTRSRVLRVGSAAVAGLLLVAAAGSYVADRHDADPYRDLPQGALTAHLGTVAPTMAGLRTNPATLTYLTQLRDCVREYPADQVAALPDNAFVYPALGLRDPFPMDWPIPMELIHDANARMLATVTALDRGGDYLVLFQTVSSATLAAGGPVPAHVAPDAPIAAASTLDGQIRAGLTGRRVTCGSFVGVWSPRHT